MKLTTENIMVVETKDMANWIAEFEGAEGIVEVHFRALIREHAKVVTVVTVEESE